MAKSKKPNRSKRTLRTSRSKVSKPAPVAPVTQLVLDDDDIIMLRDMTDIARVGDIFTVEEHALMNRVAHVAKRIESERDAETDV